MTPDVSALAAYFKANNVSPSEAIRLIDESLELRTLEGFAKHAWRQVEPNTQLQWSWHMAAVCEHLEAVTRGEIRQLLINMPPRHSKSLIVSVFWPTWMWTHSPHIKWLYSSYAQTLSTRDAVASRRLLASAWYQARWGHRFKLTGDQNTKTRYDNNKGGYRIATSVDGSNTGEGGDIIVSDDPHNVNEAESETIREGTLTWWDQAMSTRINDPKTGRFVVVMQRVHERDLSGHIIEQGGYEHLCLPAEFEPGRKSTTVLGTYDPRQVKGELLHPERFGRPEIEALKVKLGAYAAAGQLQQRPSPAEGGLFKRSWWRFWRPRGSDLPDVRGKDGHAYVTSDIPPADEQIQSWDFAVKKESEAIRKGKEPDPASGGVWQRTGSNCYLIDRVNDRMDIIEAAKAVENMTKAHPSAVKKLIEDKGNGPAVMQLLRHKIAGFISVTPRGSKVQRATSGATREDKDARAMSCTALVQAGNVYLPHPALAPWVWDFIEQFANFPLAAHDDDVDMTSQALTHLQPWIWRHEAEEADRKPLPSSYEEMDRQRFWDTVHKRLEPETSDVPERYRLTRGR